MSKLIFYIVDVFAEEKYAGNQLAVFRGIRMPSKTEMQQIAKEMHYSETTFILSENKRVCGYDVRIFTPEQEVPFAGHPTLGTAYILQHEIIKKPIKTIILNLKIGQISVAINYRGKRADVLWMKQADPTFGRIFDTKQISRVLSLNKEQIDTKFPIQSVSTGLPFIIVPLKTLNAVKQAKINRDRYFEIIKDAEAKTILIFCSETCSQENDVHVRVFADYYGVPEDPATGSGNGCLAGYLVKHRYFGKDQVNIRAEQGYEIGRSSLLFLRAQDKEGKIDVSVGGKVIMVAKGEFV